MKGSSKTPRHSTRGLGNVFSDQGNFEKADEAYLQALAIDEKSTGRTGIKVGNDLVDLAESYRAQKRYAEAEPLYRRVLAIWENSDVSPIDRASLLNNMCIFQWSKHDFHRATVTCDQALKLWKSVLGDSSPSIAAIYQNAANAHRDVGDYDVAERLYDSALAIWNKPGDDGRAATVLISKAQMYASQGNLGKAEELVEESIAHLDSSGPVASSLDASGRIEIYLKGASIMEHRNSALALLLKSKAKALGYKDQ